MGRWLLFIDFLKFLITRICVSVGESDLLEQLASVSVGDKMKMVVEDLKEDGTVTLTSDRLSEATVLASKHHATGKVDDLHQTSEI